MSTLIVYGDRLSIQVTREFKQLINISIAAGKFILIHPHYELIREAMRLEMLEDGFLEDFEVHNWQYEVGEMITFEFEEVLFFYALLDLSCRIFLCEIGDDLKNMAIESGETDDEEFIRVRSFYLVQAEKFIEQIRNTYQQNADFKELQGKVEQLNSLA
ncbi:MAG TPA: hypothetical protein PLI47_04090 [Bacteroidia bacterium]|jgi:hypothetical protein|nr:hypothetical protein [Bacteroidota bacterium]MBP9789326.1 hypothetical protein [Bacteroidia bacterium]MBK7429913.1 hypothetical protein [Bacteroidota bacterium]MBK7572975.1 hypothetical protein [Bacteroidota bacterium]MBK8583962.1 hypothetical protein [Bacteroidota bacterium]